mgnify:CR=1 FL=1
MEIFIFLESIIKMYPVLTVFVSSFFSEELIVFLAILSGKGMINFWIVFFTSIFGLLCFDFLCFLIGRSRFGDYVWKRFLSKYHKDVAGVNKKRTFFYFLITKFIYGTRLISLFYYGIRKLSYRRFFVYDFVSLVFWACILLPAGWLAGKGFDMLLNFTKGAEKLFAFVLITFILIYVIHRMAVRMLKKG